MEKKKVKILPILLVISIVLALLIFGIVYLYQKSYYNDRWYEKTVLNGVDVSGQTLEESKVLLLQKMGSYALVIKGRGNGSMTINGEEIEFGFSFTDDFDQLFDRQHATFSLFQSPKSYTTKFDVAFNSKKLRKLLKHSVLVKGNASYPIIKPQSARIKFSEDTDLFECIKEIEGNQLVFRHLYRAAIEAIDSSITYLDLTDEEVYANIYRSPKIFSTDPELQRKQNALNGSALRYIIWNMGKGITEQITPKELSKWCTYQDGEVTFDESKIATWVEAFCKKYKTTDKVRRVKMHNNQYVEVQPGDYGWQIDYEQTLQQAKESIYQEVKKKWINAYVEEPSETNKKRLTFHKKVAYANTAFQAYDGNAENLEDWDTDNFTEISLTEQMVYVIRDGKVAFSCRCISGRPTSADRITKKGAYFIKEHQTSRVLRGDDYETPVTNWVRITWSGTGFHAAPWQRWSSWSPTYYQTRGSHGCLNLTEEDASTIYKLTKYREAVFIY